MNCERPIHYLQPLETRRISGQVHHVVRSLNQQFEGYLRDLRRRLGEHFNRYRVLRGEVKMEPICTPVDFNPKGLHFSQQVGLVHEYELDEALRHFEKPCTVYVLRHPACLFCGEHPGYYGPIVFGADFAYCICGGCRHGWPKRPWRPAPISTKGGWLYFRDWLSQTAIPESVTLSKWENHSLINRWNRGDSPRHEEIDRMAGEIRCRERQKGRRRPRLVEFYQ